MVDYRTGEDHDWQGFPEPPAKPPDEYEQVMADLAASKVVILPYSEEKQRRGIRIGIARRAAARGFKTEARFTDKEIAIRKSDVPYTPPEPKPRQSRKRKEEEAIATH